MSSTAARTATTRVVTDINRTAILDALAQHGPQTRTALRERTGLSPATVDRLCTALERQGLVVRAGVEKSSGGRPSTLFRFAGERRVIVTAEVTAHVSRGLLVGLDGSVSDRVERSYGPDADPDRRLDETLELVAALVRAARAGNRSCLGVALSVPGVVDDDGRVSNSAELGWERLAVGSIVEHRTGLPTLVENDANAIAVGEWTQGVGAGTDSLVSVVLGVGLGAGIVSQGRLVRGARAGAGEIGYLLAGRDAFDRLHTRQGDLESRIGALAARYQGERGPLGTAGLLDAAAAGDAAALPLADELLDYLSLSIAALTTVLDPEVVVLSGQLPRDTTWLLHGVEGRLTGRIPFPPKVVVGALGADAPLLGVGELMARRTKGSVYLA